MQRESLNALDRKGVIKTFPAVERFQDCTQWMIEFVIFVTDEGMRLFLDDAAYQKALGLSETAHNQNQAIYPNYRRTYPPLQAQKEPS